MPSLRARLLAAYVRLVVRRSDWGDSRALARRARRLFGAPRFLSPVFAMGLVVERVDEAGVRGEWLYVHDTTADAILYIHGGGYVSCSARTHRPVTAALARLTRCRVFSIDYRLAPEARFPAAFDDCVRAYEWMTAASGQGARIAIAGDSAGGALALSTAMQVASASTPPVCVAAVSPWTDLAGTGASVTRNADRCAMFHPRNIQQFADTYLGRDVAADPRASPLYGAAETLPPVLLQVSSTELLLDDSVRMHERIVARGGSSTLSIYEDVAHGWQLVTPFVPEASRAVREMAAFIRSHVSR